MFAATRTTHVHIEAHDANEFTWYAKKDRHAPLPPLLNRHRSIQRRNFLHWGKQEHSEGSIVSDSVSRQWKPKGAAVCMSQTARDCGGGQTHGQTHSAPAPSAGNLTQLRVSRHVQPDLAGRTPAVFKGRRIYHLRQSRHRSACNTSSKKY